ncbi:hypothetical protein BC567DRAFT_76791 [Phyllosticta citribraziliensis]
MMMMMSKRRWLLQCVALRSIRVRSSDGHRPMQSTAPDPQSPAARSSQISLDGSVVVLQSPAAHAMMKRGGKMYDGEHVADLVVKPRNMQAET